MSLLMENSRERLPFASSIIEYIVGSGSLGDISSVIEGVLAIAALRNQAKLEFRTS